MLASVLKGPASSLSQSIGQGLEILLLQNLSMLQCTLHEIKRRAFFFLRRFCMKSKDQLFFSYVLLLVSDVDECFQSFALSPYFYLPEVANFDLKCNLLI